MKKFGLIACLSVLTLGLVACGGDKESTGVNTSTGNTQVSTGGNESTGGGVVENKLPVAWEEGETFQALECSVSLVPGSLKNEETGTTNADALPLKDFLHLEGARYIDLRDVSEGYGVGHIAGFESISYFRLIEGEGHLFSRNAETGVWTPNYEQSVSILKTLFPQDKTYFVMCAVGGRVVPFLTLLAQYGYNMDNVYNIGGWKQLAEYKGEEKFAGYDVALGLAAAQTEYDFGDLTPIEAE